jgi:hypothetical protein
VPNGLLEVPAVMLTRGATFATDIQPVIGVAAAVLAAILAAHASWHITDRIMSWRQRADREEL